MQQGLIFKTVMLDGDELTAQMLDEKAHLDVSNFETCVIEAVPFETAAEEILRKIYDDYPKIPKQLEELTALIREQSADIEQSFIYFVEASTNVFLSIERALEILELDADAVIIDGISLSAVLEALFDSYVALREELRLVDDSADSVDFSGILQLLENDVKANVVKLQSFLKKILEENSAQ